MTAVSHYHLNHWGNFSKQKVVHNNREHLCSDPFLGTLPIYHRKIIFYVICKPENAFFFLLLHKMWPKVALVLFMFQDRVSVHNSLFRIAFIQLQWTWVISGFLETLLCSLTLNTIQQGKLQQHNCQCYWYCNTYTHNKNSTPSLYSNMFITCVCALKKKNGAMCPTNAGTNVYIMHSLCSSRSKYTKTCGHEQKKKKVNTEIHPKYGENKFSLPAMQQGTLVMQMRDWWIVRIVN